MDETGTRGTVDAIGGTPVRTPSDGCDDADWRPLARAWPRSLIAAGQGRELARWWRTQERAAASRGEPPLVRVTAAKSLLDQLAAARRARRLHRGLEGAAAVLASEEAGLRATAATRSGADGVRISRLLVVSADGSARFYRQVIALRREYASRLEVVMLDCDEARLGDALYGQERRVRAVLLSHKDAVAQLLSLLEEGLLPSSSSQALPRGPISGRQAELEAELEVELKEEGK